MMITASSLPVQAAAAALVCSEPSVVDCVVAELNTGPTYTRFDSALIVDAPASGSWVVRCPLGHSILLCEIARCEDVSAGRCEFHSFAARALRNGFVVNPAR
jgi:hypothetical protein